jgi:dipeptidyl aminopeptidase/acylaminoacyl peptidase
MQDDLADALAWSVKHQGVDAERVCIMGTSYGGYAALMGPVTHPGLYRCAISYAGVTDLSLMFEADGTDVSQQHRRFSYPRLIGDPKADAEMLRRHSPLHRVAEIKVPVLLAQGQLDRRVTRQHAETFVSAARRAGVEVEQVEYPLEAHSWFVDDNRVDFLQRVEALLERTLKTKP